MTSNIEMISVFIALFVIFVILGFWASRFRRGNLSDLGEWSLAGRRLGMFLAWFLVGADLYTAYTFIAIPSALFANGTIYFFAVPYVGIAFGVAIITMPRLWKMSRKKNYVTAVDMVHDRYNSKTLTILIAITGIVAELPYIALQIYGMQAVLTVMIGQSVTADVGVISEIALILSFIILAAFTFTSGLRGATITAVMKDAIILVSVVVVIIVIPLTIKGGFAGAISTATTASPVINSAAKNFTVLPNLLLNGFISLAIMSALALYLYPHAINGILSANSAKNLRTSTALLPLYGIGLALLALFGILVYASPGAMHIIAPGYNSATNTLAPGSTVSSVLAVPALIYANFPGWFVGFAFLGIFIGGLVPASIMAISQANLLTRNVAKFFRPNMTPAEETRLAKWASVVFKFIALGFIFLVSASSALQLQLLGGIIILQTLPAIFLTMYTRKLTKYGLVAGWIGGMGLGVYLAYAANVHNGVFKTFSTSLFNFGAPFGPMFVGLAALALNLLLVLIVSLASGGLKNKPVAASD